MMSWPIFLNLIWYYRWLLSTWASYSKDPRFKYWPRFSYPARGFLWCC